MGITDKANELKDKAKDALSSDDAVDQVKDKVNDATDGKFSDQVEQGADKARELKDKLGG
jgi:MT0933-like antitoxin protein